MAVSDAYATDVEYRTGSGKAGSGTDASLNADLLAVSRYIDGELGRNFTKDANDVARQFDAPRIKSRHYRADWAESENPWLYGGLTRRLEIDDLVSVTSIIIDSARSGTFTAPPLAATDYQLWPPNAPTGPEPAPYIAIELTEWGSQAGWPPHAPIQITGKWGWPAVPIGVKQACIQLTAILRNESPRARREMTAPGVVLGMSAQAQSIVMDLINSYAKVNL